MYVYILDAILNMVNNIAANVLGATPELEGGTESEGTGPSDTLSFQSCLFCVVLCCFDRSEILQL